MKISLRIGINFMSYSGVMAASNVPNCESIPRRINMAKKSTAQRGETSIKVMASENVMKAKPGPDPTYDIDQYQSRGHIVNLQWPFLQYLYHLSYD